jgi:hypothetical protein
MRALILIIALLGLAACGTYAVDRPPQISKRLAPSATAYVSVPPDGKYGRTVYTGSGAMAAQIVATAFARHLDHVEEASAPQTFDLALERAKELKAAYLIAPAILHWEDRARFWSGRSDKAELQIAVVDVTTGQTIEHAVVGGIKGWPVFRNIHPQKLLPRPVGEYVDSLF